MLHPSRGIMLMMGGNKISWRRTAALLFVSVGIAVASYFVLAPVVQRVRDNYTLSHADPTMAALADQSGMSRQGKLVFLRTQPQLVSDTQMQTVCAQNTAANNHNGFIEQGCYSPSANRIYIRRMPADLQKLEATTAAYEMLHPVYISLHSSAVRAPTLDQAIEVNYANLHDARLSAQVANFASTEPEARDLELFSLLGTGYSNLSDTLIGYYAPYFDNRNATVAATKAIDARFQQLQGQLSQIKSQIDQTNTEANDAYATSVRHARAGDATGNDYYYAQYRQYIKQENGIIDSYNTVLASYNALVTEYNGSQPVKGISPAQTQSQ